MRGALTTYNQNGISYGSYVVYSDERNIKEAIRLRGLGEVVDGFQEDVNMLPDYSTLNDNDLFEALPEVLHWATFVGYVAMNAGKCDYVFLLSDKGIIHEIAHLIQLKEMRTPEAAEGLRGMIKQLQARAIGFYYPV